ncbi:MAG: hypothetical protein H0X73_10780 [Chthoniobacterales bacterium]|nr:hypothetical protein [Chthoniobacterales bacterium]
MHAWKLVAVASLICGASATATELNVIKRDGRHYVSFRDVAEFYHVEHSEDANQNVSLRSYRRGIRAEPDSSEICINGVRSFTNLPIVGKGDESLISATDVGKIVEPVLRPSRIHNAQSLETVVLDPVHRGTDQGATNSWDTEKGFDLDVALPAREQLLRAGVRPPPEQEPTVSFNGGE